MSGISFLSCKPKPLPWGLLRGSTEQYAHWYTHLATYLPVTYVHVIYTYTLTCPI